jgi:hypothetical protein
MVMNLCEPITGLPAEGFWGMITFGTYPDKPVTSLLSGLVRGPVSSVVIDLPSGPAQAHLVPAADPELGTFSWITVPGALRAEPGSEKLVTPARTVYRGATPVFHCEDEECLGGL